ncbi:Cytochrome P450 [Octadecabacter temperatus]|uniref:Putative cytochrome P450 124 n=1 Tax=Octadecabacter temperatus TaxID=1458307 RepID=A0A0K0Y5B7_9RHOB|nr:cytochrome P450 [Octadecabacter temperatus]AKS46140.1 Putative cytochrome P450 124 [Octadecabacter temperatus]SIO08289.1 Cytochrome P450 [Octadecabacter temperatus]
MKPQLAADLSDQGHFDHGIPQDVFKDLRAMDGLAWNPLPSEGPDEGFWSVGRFDDVLAVSRDPETFSSATGHIQMYNIDDDALSARASMIDMDPPDHTRLRRLVNPGFIPKVIRTYTDIVRERASALLDDMMSQGGGDWVSKVAKPIPIGIICDMLGVPEEDRDLMIEMTDYLVAGTSAEPLDPNAYGNTTPLRLLPFNSPAAHGLREYARKLGEERRANPKDDLISQLVTMEIDGEMLTDEEYTNFFRLLIFAGNETTRTAMSHMALQLSQYPEQFARLKDEPELIDTAVEEIVRYSSPIMYFRRTATKDTELSGTKIAAGDRVVMWYASANFDDTRFDDAQTFDIARPKMPIHAGYGGGGVHTCLGAGLARIELKVLLEEILARDLKIEIDGEPEYVNTNFVNGVEVLNIRLTQGTGA